MKKALFLGMFAAIAWVSVRHFYPMYITKMVEKDAPPIAMKKPPVAVTVVRATIQDVPQTLELIGRAEAYESVTIKSRIEGQVIALPFAEGQPITTGTVIAKLDPADVDARLRQAEANLARDQAQLAKARRDVVRLSSLETHGFSTEQQLEDAQAAVTVLAATVQADSATVELARLQQSYTTIKAPFSGIIGSKLLSVGANVKANDTGFAVMQRVRPIFVRFSVSEQHLPYLRATVSKGGVPLTITIPDSPQEPLPAEATFLDNMVDATTATAQMRATFANTEQQLMPGQFVRVTLALETLEKVLAVPTEAIQQGQEGPLAFIIDPESHIAEARSVKVRLFKGDVAVIEQGINAGDFVVTQGHLKLSPGAHVAISSGKE